MCVIKFVKEAFYHLVGREILSRFGNWVPKFPALDKKCVMDTYRLITIWPSMCYM